MRISDWSSDVCSSDLICRYGVSLRPAPTSPPRIASTSLRLGAWAPLLEQTTAAVAAAKRRWVSSPASPAVSMLAMKPPRQASPAPTVSATMTANDGRSEEHTSELQSLMRNSYAVFCLKKKTTHNTETNTK